MKKILLRVLILCLALGLSAASAETGVTALELSARGLELNEAANTLMMQGEDRLYRVVDAQGNALSESYADMRVRNGFYRVDNREGVNSYGLLDGSGQLIIPMEYGDIEVISDRWQDAVVLVEATT